MERATGIEPVLPAWESKLSTLYFQHLQNRIIEICVHALHTVHAPADLRIAGGRFGGRLSTVLLLCRVRIEPRRFSVGDEFIYWQHQDKCSKDQICKRTNSARWATESESIVKGAI